MASLSPRVDLRGSFGPIRSQGPRPTCLAFAASAAHEHARQHAEPLSPEALFRACEQRDPPAAKLGTTLSVAMTAIQEDGQCNEVAWPYGATDPSDADATYYRARNQAREQSELVDFIRKTLAAGRSLLVALQLTDAWHSVGNDGVIVGPSTNDQHLGAHAVVVVGHDPRRQRILIRNSWGRRWGNDGYAWLTESYLRKYGFEAATLEALAVSASASSVPTPI